MKKIARLQYGADGTIFLKRGEKSKKLNITKEELSILNIIRSYRKNKSHHFNRYMENLFYTKFSPNFKGMQFSSHGKEVLFMVKYCLSNNININLSSIPKNISSIFPFIKIENRQLFCIEFPQIPILFIKDDILHISPELWKSYNKSWYIYLLSYFISNFFLLSEREVSISIRKNDAQDIVNVIIDIQGQWDVCLCYLSSNNIKIDLRKKKFINYTKESLMTVENNIILCLNAKLSQDQEKTLKNLFFLIEILKIPIASKLREELEEKILFITMKYK